jgi:hypothetical protein
MERKPMSRPTFANFLLRARLALSCWNPLTVGAAVLLLASAGSLAWSLQAVRMLQATGEARHASAASAARISAAKAAAAPVAPAAAAASPDNLDLFYGALAERGAAAQQIKTLFGLAAKNGLTLAQGEYKSAYDRNARVHTYQVNLPVKGAYGAVWQFAFDVLRAIPSASLDDIGLRRDAIGDPVVEARLRLTFYLIDRPGRAEEGTR